MTKFPKRTIRPPGSANSIASKDEPKKKIDPLTREEIQVLLKACLEKRPHWYPLFLCACGTGLRIGELIALKGMDLDFNSRFIHVQRNLSRTKISVPKNGRDRKVDMSSMLAGTLTNCYHCTAPKPCRKK